MLITNIASIVLALAAAALFVLAASMRPRRRPPAPPPLSIYTWHVYHPHSFSEYGIVGRCASLPAAVARLERAAGRSPGRCHTRQVSSRTWEVLDDAQLLGHVAGHDPTARDYSEDDIAKIEDHESAAAAGATA